MKVNSRAVPTHQRIDDMSGGTCFLYPSSVPTIPDYVLIKLSFPSKMVAARLSDGCVLRETDYDKNALFETLPNAQITY